MKNDNISKSKTVKLVWILLMAAAGVAMLILGGVMNGREKQDGEETAVQQIPYDAQAYAKQVEDRVAEICTRVEGAGRTCVVVSLGGGYDAVYAVNMQSGSSGSRSEFVLTGSGASEQALLIGYTVPQISGIGIVCEGGADEAVRNRIVSLVSAAFSVSASKIYVAPMQQ